MWFGVLFSPSTKAIFNYKHLITSDTEVSVVLERSAELTCMHAWFNESVLPMQPS